MLDRRCALSAAAAGRLVGGLLLAVDDPGSGWGRPGPSGRELGSVEEMRRERVQALVGLAQSGDRDAFSALYEEYVGLVYHYAYVRTGNRQQAEDLTSETFLRALRRIDTFTWQGRDIAAWFVTITRNLIIDVAKSAIFRLEVTSADLPEDRDDALASPEARTLRRERAEQVLDALRSLTPDQAECLVLRFMEGLSLAECALILGRSENAVKQLQLRAIRAMRRELGREP